MVVVPTATRVTTPFASMVATPVLLDSQVTVAPLMVLFSLSLTVAVRVPAFVPW